MSRRRKHPQSRWFTLVGLLVVSGALIGLLSLPSVDAATGTFGQARQKRITSGTVNSLAFTNPNTAGNLIVVYVAWNNTGPVVLSDTRGNTYTSVAPATAWGSTNSWRSQLFYAKNISGGDNTVTATFGTAITSFGKLLIHEYSGLDRNNPLDAERLQHRYDERHEQRLGDDHQWQRPDLWRRLVERRGERGRNGVHEPPEWQRLPDRGQERDLGRFL